MSEDEILLDEDLLVFINMRAILKVRSMIMKDLRFLSGIIFYFQHSHYVVQQTWRSDRAVLLSNCGSPILLGSQNNHHLVPLSAHLREVLLAQKFFVV